MKFRNQNEIYITIPNNKQNFSGLVYIKKRNENHNICIVIKDFCNRKSPNFWPKGFELTLHTGEFAFRKK